MKKLRFDELPLSGHILSAVEEMGFEEASPIQSETIPVILEGRDVIGQAQTGTGKTAAFAIPVIEQLEPGSRQLQAVVLCPTRELVIQVTEEFRKLMKFMGTTSDSSVVAVYGGQEIDRQFRALKKRPLVIVGTPGRLMDHMRRGSISLSSVTMAVLDEADEMLDMGFREDIEFILADTPSDRQTIMFSATMSKDILALMREYQRDPAVLDVTGQKINAPAIEQYYYEIPEKSKPEAVARLVDFYDIKLALVFCNTKNKVDELVEVLKTRGYFAEGLHGDMSQRQREKVMSGFRTGTVEVLVATDVAGRGIDVNNIAAVFNYDLPRDDEDYIHRIGRTGRAGKSGKSFTFVTGREMYSLRRIERTNNIKITRGTIPTIGDLDTTQARNYKDKITNLINEGALARYIHIVEGIMGDEYTSLDIAAALMKLSMDGKSDGYDESQTFEVRKDSGTERNKKSERQKKISSRKSFGSKGADSRRKKSFREDGFSGRGSFSGRQDRDSGGSGRPGRKEWDSGGSGRPGRPERDSNGGSRSGRGSGTPERGYRVEKSRNKERPRKEEKAQEPWWSSFSSDSTPSKGKKKKGKK